MPGEPHDATQKFASDGVPAQFPLSATSCHVTRVFGVVTVMKICADLDMKLNSEHPDDQMLGPPTPQPQAAPHSCNAI